jgi:hypothetical protein
MQWSRLAFGFVKLVKAVRLYFPLARFLTVGASNDRMVTKAKKSSLTPVLND